MIKFIKIFPALITLLNILEGAHMLSEVKRAHTHTHRERRGREVGLKKKKKNTQWREILHKSIKADKAPSISPMTQPRARKHALRD